MMLVKAICSWFMKNVLPGLLVSLVLVLFILAAGEMYIRYTRPFFNTTWPSRFSPDVGFLFSAHSEVRWTNHQDFWASETTNSLGFLDRELKVPSSQCHVAVIGDSFVEAAQVRNDEKVQARLEAFAAVSAPELKLTADGWGYSGTGQLNQLPFYDVHVAKRHPHLVVLVFVGNDFRNNSALLESVANGWNPDHLPRVFARRVGEKFALTEIDSKWDRLALPLRMEPAPPPGLVEALRWESKLFDWVYRRLAHLYPQFVGTEASERARRLYRGRHEHLRAKPEFAPLLSDWQFDGRVAELDHTFYDEALPKVFRDALDYTEFALSEFRSRVEGNGGRLVVLATSEMGKQPVGREGPINWQMERLNAIAQRVGIPVIDQRRYIVGRGGDPDQARFRNDGHWSPKGHEWAAEAILAYLKSGANVCGRPGAEGRDGQ